MGATGSLTAHDFPARPLPAVKLIAPLGAALAIACQAASAPLPEPARCGPSVPPTAQHPIATPAASLAGDYDLIQVQTQPKSGLVVSGLLHLMPLDSAARAAATGAPGRDLTGWLQPGPEAGQEMVQAVLAGEHLRLRRVGDSVQHLTITAVAPEGFWGWWKADPGVVVATDAGTQRIVPDPAGYFCALRRGSAR